MGICHDYMWLQFGLVDPNISCTIWMYWEWPWMHVSFHSTWNGSVTQNLSSILWPSINDATGRVLFVWHGVGQSSQTLSPQFCYFIGPLLHYIPRFGSKYGHIENNLGCMYHSIEHGMDRSPKTRCPHYGHPQMTQPDVSFLFDMVWVSRFKPCHHSFAISLDIISQGLGQSTTPPYPHQCVSLLTSDNGFEWVDGIIITIRVCLVMFRCIGCIGRTYFGQHVFNSSMLDMDLGQPPQTF